MLNQISPALRGSLKKFDRVAYVVLALTLLAAPIFLLNQTATAAQITNRSLTISSAVPSNTGTTYTFGFKNATAGAIQALSFQACTTPLGVCTAPGGLNIEGNGVLTAGAFGGFAGSITALAQDTTHTPNYTNANICSANNVYCITFTDATSQTAATALTVTFANVTNPSATNSSFYFRIYDWTAAAVTGTPVDNGNVASSTTQTLTVNANIQEVLTFCVGNTAIDNATSSVATCGTISGTSVNLGTLNSANTNVTPVPTSVNGDANNGLAELNTNAANGSSVTYNAIQQSGTNHNGTLKVAGATCAAGSTFTDQCINAIGVTHSTIVTGTEAFGMTIAGINCSNVTAYTCTFSTGTYNLTRAANYNCQGTNTYPASENGQVTGTTTCSYAWDETGTSQAIASSTGPVGNEAMILKFATTPEITTPTGAYTALANFVATPTF